MITNWKATKDGEAPRYRGYKMTIDGCNITGKKIYVYGYYYHDYKRDPYYTGPRLVHTGTAPFEFETGMYVSNGNWSYDIMYLLFTNKQYDTSTLLSQVPLKHWYSFRWYSNRARGPHRAYYEPGDCIEFKNRTECSSSSDSCHHTSAVWTYLDGKWGGGSSYHNHSGSYTTSITIPNDKRKHDIYMSSSSSSSHPSDYTTMSKIYTIYDFADAYSPFGSPDMVKVKVNGAWIDCSELKVKVNGAWSEPKGIYYKKNGAWVNIY